jgi:hypothetical protein
MQEDQERRRSLHFPYRETLQGYDRNKHFFKEKFQVRFQDSLSSGLAIAVENQRSE